MKKSLFFLLLCMLFSNTAGAGLVITEVMQNPAAVSDANGEWFEIFNSGPNSLDLDGFEFSDNGTNSFTITGSLVIASGDYLVLGRNSDSATNGGINVDYEYSGGFTLANGDDEIVISFNNVEYDRIEYDGGTAWPQPTGSSEGASMMLIGTDAGIDNNIGSNWQLSTMGIGNGDFGTPGFGSFSAVPEPTSLAYGMLALTTLTLRRRRR